MSRRAVLALAPAMIIGPRRALAQVDDPGPVLAAYTEEVGPTALLAVRAGQPLFSHGDPARKVPVASVRKSLIGALYGIAVAERQLDLADTLEKLGIDDLAPSLSSAERQATVADLLASRSGIYHVSARETVDMRRRRPERGSHPPGTFWFYNNWDFNVLGTIYRQRTGEDIFQSFAERIARPIGMQDFVPADGRYARSPASEHAAYVFSLSTRDMLRFGEMVLGQGQWAGKRVVPADWLAASLTARSQSARPGLGYGYLWWTLPAERFGTGAGFAAGHGGQHIAVLSRQRMVLAQTIARRPDAGGGTTRRFVQLLNRLAAG